MDALEEIKRQLYRLNSWPRFSGCQRFSYDKIRNIPEQVVWSILNQTGTDVDIREVLLPFENKANIIHYNIGGSGQYKDIMKEEEKKAFQKEFYFYQVLY